jgi:hypothetical protein
MNWGVGDVGQRQLNEEMPILQKGLEEVEVIDGK